MMSKIDRRENYLEFESLNNRSNLKWKMFQPKVLSCQIINPFFQVKSFTFFQVKFQPDFSSASSRLCYDSHLWFFWQFASDIGSFSSSPCSSSSTFSSLSNSRQTFLKISGNSNIVGLMGPMMVIFFVRPEVSKNIWQQIDGFCFLYVFCW